MSTPELPTPWARDFAARHHLTLHFERFLPGGVPAYKYRDGDQLVVVLDESLPPERQHFSLAHEAAHLLLGHEGGVQPDEEAEANRLAAELLLPDPPFRGDAHEDLRALKEIYPHASFEALARRRLAFVPGVLTVIDNGSVTRRLTSDGFAAPDRLTPPEWELARRCETEREDVAGVVEGYRLHATYVDDGRGVVRVLLVVEEA